MSTATSTTATRNEVRPVFLRIKQVLEEDRGHGSALSERGGAGRLEEKTA